MSCSIRVKSFVDLPCWLNHVLLWLHEQQALVSGILALVVGLGTVLMLRRQRHRSTERRLELLSLKAAATVAVSEVFRYSEDCLGYLSKTMTVDGKLHGEDIFDAEFDAGLKSDVEGIPVYPTSAFDLLAELIKYSDECDAAALHEIISFAQVQRSTFSRFVSVLLGVDDSGLVLHTGKLYSEIRDALGLRQHMARLFDWSRVRSEHIPPICESEQAADALNWIGLGREEVVDYISEHWPPRNPSGAGR